MNAKGNFELADVPQLIERGNFRSLLGARAALTDAAGVILEAAGAQARSMTAEESARFDDLMAQAREITARLDREREQRVRGLAQLGISPAEVR